MIIVNYADKWLVIKANHSRGIVLATADTERDALIALERMKETFRLLPITPKSDDPTLTTKQKTKQLMLERLARIHKKPS